MTTITQLTIVRPRTGETEVWLDGEPWRLVTGETVILRRLRLERDLSDDELREIATEDDERRARQALAGYTALTLRSTGQARNNLRRKGFGDEVIEAAIAYGYELDWLDDERFARAYARQQTALRPCGPRKLIVGLEGKGVDRDLARQTVDEEGPDEEAQRAGAELAASKRLAAWRGRYDRTKTRSKLMTYLVRQGYEIDMVRDVVERMTDDDL